MIETYSDLINEIMGEHPDINAYGFKSNSRNGLDKDREYMKTDEFIDAVARCVDFLHDVKDIRIQNINRSISTYSLKHRVEEWCSDVLGLKKYQEHYVPEGAFIVAAIILGFDVAKGKVPNCYINVKTKVGRQFPKKYVPPSSEYN